jgi:hypothetical protein
VTARIAPRIGDTAPGAEPGKPAAAGRDGPQ